MTATVRELRSEYERFVRLLLTPEQAAAELGIGRTRIYHLISAGAIESVKLGRSRRIPRVCLEEFVERQLSHSRRGEC